MTRPRKADTVRLDTLEPGSRFAIESINVEGVLLSLSIGSARVRYNRVTPVAMANGVRFDRPSAATNISLHTEVIPA